MIEDLDLSFHVQRSKTIDALGDMETALRELLARNGVNLAGETLGQQVEKARGLKAGPMLSKALFAKLGPLLDRAETIVALRNDIVHSRMHGMHGEKVRMACFIHTQPRGRYGSHARVLTLAEFEGFTREVRKIAGEFRSLKINPASSPRLPEPGGAGDP